MANRVAIAIAAIIVVIAAVVGYIYIQRGVAGTSSSTISSANTLTTTTSVSTVSRELPPSSTTRTLAKPTASEGFEIPSGIASVCRDIGNGQPLGQNIRWLFDHHNEFRFLLREYPENRTVVWIIVGPSREALETLVSHVEQMECVVKHGGNPRPFDPLFRVDAEISAKYVHTEIRWLNNTAIEIVKKADNDCAWLVIKLHAQVVRGFFTEGRTEAQKIHEVPQEALEVCKPYLG